MDRRWPRAALLILLAAEAPAGLPIKEARWTALEAGVAPLLTAPAECAKSPEGSAAIASFLTGRVVFNTPTLLGGQAARAGLSCASCHVNGRGNVHFAFPGLSGTPGTADVSSSVMSSKRGDGVANPVHIPDLAFDTPKISRAPDDPALRTFIRGLVVEEFDGPEPEPAVLDGLVEYVRSMSPMACKSTGPVPRTASSELAQAADAAELALYYAARDQEGTARIMLAAARAALGRVHERFPGETLKPARKQLERLDSGLASLQRSSLGSGKPVARKLTRWQADLAKTRPMIRATEPQSLYIEANLLNRD
jgi:hypothetical protein